jgi:glutamate-ammonia-ligase adenylyltransferase
LTQFKLVEVHYGALFEKIPEPATSAPGIVVADDTDPGALASLEELGFTNPAAAVSAIQAWQSGRYAATRSAKSRERLTKFLPHLLEAFSRTAEPDLALATFDKVIARLPAGLQLFSLFAANPSLLRLVADIMGTAPRLARIIGRRPRLLDVVLDPGFFGAVPTEPELKDIVSGAIGQAADYQDALDLARVVGREQGFLIGVRVMSGTISARQAGAAYAALAETLIEVLSDRVADELVLQHGHMPGGETAVIAMGKLGGNEMSAASDLDLITVYDFDDGDKQSDGARSLPGTQYYTRYTQRLIAALSAPTAEGSLYEVDMRLRPSGSQGPVATKLSGFIDYQEKSAWTWEHLALTRARVVTGPAALRKAIDDTIGQVLTRPRDRVAVAAEVQTMRGKIAQEKGTADIWSLKQVRGGLIDLEFIAQFLQLINAAERPDVLDQNTETALTKLSDAGVLSPDDAEILIPAARLYFTLRASGARDRDAGFRCAGGQAEGHARGRARGVRSHYRVRTAWWALSARGERLFGRWLRGSRGQAAGDCRAFAFAALDLECAAMQLDQRAGDGQPEAAALMALGELVRNLCERFAELGKVGFGDTDARILYDDLHLTAAA